MSVTYLEAIREAQAYLLEHDSRVYIYGQDVGAFGGAFKATKNLAQRFPERVIDAPISEDAMIGSAVGAAIEGMRPIIEIQFADFSTVGFNQVVNQAAMHYVNRLSDHLFVLARQLNNNGKTDILWRPGENSGQK